jgi:hypothetical protein
MEWHPQIRGLNLPSQHLESKSTGEIWKSKFKKQNLYRRKAWFRVDGNVRSQEEELSRITWLYFHWTIPVPGLEAVYGWITMWHVGDGDSVVRWEVKKFRNFEGTKPTRQRFRIKRKNSSNSGHLREYA